jgi:hypothetical protein
MLEIAMDSPTGVTAPPDEADWRELAEHIEQAFGQLAHDPLVALTQLHEIEQQASALIDRVMEHAVREARQSGKSWAEIAVATDVTRQAAWRRWFDRGIR